MQVGRLIGVRQTLSMSSAVSSPCPAARSSASTVAGVVSAAVLDGAWVSAATVVDASESAKADWPGRDRHGQQSATAQGATTQAGSRTLRVVGGDRCLNDVAAGHECAGKGRRKRDSPL